MDNKARKIQAILTKVELQGDEIASMFNTEVILLWQQACVSLIAKLKADEMLLSTVEVIAVVKDDIRMVEKNLKTLKGVEKLVRLELNQFCLN